jgi:mono/diheme cytochrome c family protein
MTGSAVAAALRRFLVASCWAGVAPVIAVADDAATAGGERLYEKYCATCHGDELQNNSGIAFDLRRLKADEHPRFVNALQHGKNAMPSWQGVLTPEQIEALWRYIRANAYQP